MGHLSRHFNQCRTGPQSFRDDRSLRDFGAQSRCHILVDLGLPVTMEDLDVALIAAFEEIFGGDPAR